MDIKKYAADIEMYAAEQVTQFIDAHRDDIKCENFQALMDDVWNLTPIVRGTLCDTFQKYRIDYIPELLKDSPEKVTIPLSWLVKNPIVYDGEILKLPLVGNNVLISSDYFEIRTIPTIMVGTLNARSKWLQDVDFEVLKIEHSNYDGVLIPWSKKMRKVYIPAGVKDVLTDYRMQNLKYIYASLDPIIYAPKSCEPLNFLGRKDEVKEYLKSITEYY